jgi:hypothetical protein
MRGIRRKIMIFIKLPPVFCTAFLIGFKNYEIKKGPLPSDNDPKVTF